MASSLATSIRQRLYTFAGRFARPFTDSRRHRSLTDMVTGLVIAGHLHLTKIARALSRGLGNIHAQGDLQYSYRSHFANDCAAPSGSPSRPRVQ